jgi:hypothetical protein
MHKRQVECHLGLEMEIGQKLSNNTKGNWGDGVCQQEKRVVRERCPNCRRDIGRLTNR